MTRAAVRVVQAGSVAVVLAALPYKTFDLDRYSVPKEWVLGITACVAALLILRTLTKPVVVTRVDALLLAFLALSSASAAPAVNGWLAWRALGLSLAGLTLFWVARALARQGYARALLAGVGVAVVVTAATALAQAYGVRWDLFSLNRAPGGTLGNRNFVAHLVAIGLPGLVLFALGPTPLRPGGSGDARWWGRIVALLSVGVASWALVLSRSRAAWLAVAIAAALAVIALLRTREFPRFRLLPLLAAVAAGALAAVALPNTLHWKSRSPYLDSAVGVADYREGSGHGRVIQYRTTLRMAVAHPVLGVGPGNWPVVYPQVATPNDPSLDGDDGMTANPWPSSDWAAFTSERGLVATLCLALVLIALAASRGASPALVATVAIVMVVGLFDAVLLLPAPALLIWVTLGALAPPPSQGARIPLPRALVALAVVVLGACAIVRSTQQAVGMALANDETTPNALELAARVDPGSYRIQIRLAEAYEHRGRCAGVLSHATAAHHLFPHAPAPRRLLNACRRQS